MQRCMVKDKYSTRENSSYVMGEITLSDDIAEQFKGIEMRSLIGSPLKAAADAQRLLAEDTADFIAKVGMTDTSDSIAEKWNKEGYKRGSSDVLPLGIEKVPDLSAEKVNISFDMHVKASSKDDETKKNEKF